MCEVLRIVDMALLQTLTGEPGGLPSLGSHRVGHDWSDLAAAAAAAQYMSTIAIAQHLVSS